MNLQGRLELNLRKIHLSVQIFRHLQIFEKFSLTRLMFKQLNHIFNSNRLTFRDTKYLNI